MSNPQTFTESYQRVMIMSVGASLALWLSQKYGVRALKAKDAQRHQKKLPAAWKSQRLGFFTSGVWG